MTPTIAIHSGGQCGADAGGLFAARILGLATGGWAPKGWRTDKGPAPWLESYGLREHTSTSYPPRTKLNVEGTDGTFILGILGSPGCSLTRAYAEAKNKPLFTVPWVNGQPLPPVEIRWAFNQWLVQNNVRVLNVAGNRETSNPGIEAVVVWFLTMSMDANHLGRMAAAPLPAWSTPPAVGARTPAAVGTGAAPVFDTVVRQPDGTYQQSTCSIPGGCNLPEGWVHPPEALPHLAARWVLQRQRDLGG